MNNLKLFASINLEVILQHQPYVELFNRLNGFVQHFVWRFLQLLLQAINRAFVHLQQKLPQLLNPLRLCVGRLQLLGFLYEFVKHAVKVQIDILSFVYVKRVRVVEVDKHVVLEL